MSDAGPLEPRTITVGPLRDSWIVEHARAYLRSIGHEAALDERRWNAPERERVLEVGSLRSVLRLRDHAERHTRLGGVRFDHVPYAPASIWVPLEIGQPRMPLFDEKIEPVFFGSSVTLRAELDRLRALLEPELGAFPDWRGDVVADEPEPVKTTWRGLRIAAELSIARSTAMHGFA